jgi:Flp pilus assembly secretin CpaC
MVKDGQTIIIGGLFRDTVTTAKHQIPLIGDLPFVGTLFKGTANQTKRQEVMVLLTPHVIEEPEETDGQARAADIGRKRLGAKDEMEWVNGSRMAEDNYAKAVKYYLAGDKKAALNKLNWALSVRPTYMEASRLKERIIRETTPDDKAAMERIMLDVIEREESGNWIRR